MVPGVPPRGWFEWTLWVFSLIAAIGVVLTAVGVAAALVGVWRTRTLVTFGEADSQAVPNLPALVRVAIPVAVTANGWWRQKKFDVVIRQVSFWPWKRRRISDLRYDGHHRFPRSHKETWDGTVRWQFTRPEAQHVKVKLKIKLAPHGKRTFREKVTLIQPQPSN